MPPLFVCNCLLNGTGSKLHQRVPETKTIMDNFPFVLGFIIAIIGGVSMIKAIKRQGAQRLYAFVAIIFVSMLPGVAFAIFAGNRAGVLYCLSWLIVMCLGTGAYLKHRR